MDTVEKANVTNVEVGESIGLSDAMVSRIRSGHRLPSIETMQRIAQVYGWTVEAQVRSRGGNYGQHFERILRERKG